MPVSGEDQLRSCYCLFVKEHVHSTTNQYDTAATAAAVIASMSSQCSSMFCLL